MRLLSVEDREDNKDGPHNYPFSSLSHSFIWMLLCFIVLTLPWRIQPYLSIACKDEEDKDDNECDRWSWWQRWWRTAPTRRHKWKGLRAHAFPYKDKEQKRRTILFLLLPPYFLPPFFSSLRFPFHFSFPFNRINYISTADGRRRLDSSSSPPVAVWVYHTRSFHKPSLNLPSLFFYEQSATYYTSVDMCFVFLFAFVVCRLCAGCRYMRCLCIRACPLQYFSIEWA